MTSPVAEPVAAPIPAKPASRWEDFMDIFYAPTSVYERRQNQSPWPTILIVTVLLVIISVLTFNATAPAFEAELRHAMAKAMAKTPQMTQDMADKSISFSMIGKKWGAVLFPLGVLFFAVFIWLVAKIVGAKETYGGALIVIAYASIIGVLSSIVTGAQALVLDVSGMTTPDQLSLSVARFMDKATTSPALYAVAKQLDVFGIWALVVMAIGVRVTGKTSRNAAIAFAIIWWVLATGIIAALAARQAA
jgi:hypothetical protein